MEVIGFIGLGIMGKPMALNLMKAGHRLVVTSRSRKPVDEVVAAGATGAGPPAEVARAATIIITMVPDTPDVEKVLTGENGVLTELKPGAVVIDMSTISPVVTKKLAAQVAAKGGSMLDAPVSGGEIGAINASLSIMVGGEQTAFDAVKPILDVMGNPDRVIRIGDSGAGQICKVCNQMVIGGTLVAVSEAFALARKAQVNVALVRDALLGGFAASKVLDVHGQRMLESNYKPGFRAKLFAKDLKIAISTLAENETAAPVSSVVQQLVTALLADGRGEDDYSGLATVLFGLAGLKESK